MHRDEQFGRLSQHGLGQPSTRLKPEYTDPESLQREQHPESRPEGCSVSPVLKGCRASSEDLPPQPAKAESLDRLPEKLLLTPEL